MDIKNIDKKGDGEKTRDTLYNFLKSRLIPPKQTPFSCRNSIHDDIKCQLYLLAKELYLLPIPEGKWSNLTKTRIDMLWIKDSEIYSAFEIDYSIKKNSIFKLTSIKAKNKFVISIARKRYFAIMKRNELLSPEIKRICLYH